MARWAIIDENEQVTDYRSVGEDFVYDPDEHGDLSSGLPVMRPVEVDPHPTFDPLTHELDPAPIVEVLPDKVTWKWQTRPRDPAVIAEEQRQAALAADADVVDILARLRAASPAQINSWIDTNVTTLASARTVLKAIVKVLASATRRVG